MASQKELSGAQIANQLIAMQDLVEALGFDFSKLTLSEAFALKSAIKKAIKKQLK